MTVCFMCDLHLPYHPNASQYDAFRFFLSEIARRKPDVFVYAGDYTANGDPVCANRFFKGITSLKCPCVCIPGNSDLRTTETADEMRKKAAPTVNRFGGVTIYAVNDSDKTVDDPVFSALEAASPSDLVVLHHPYTSLKEPSRSRFAAWRSAHPETRVFYAHLHESLRKGNDISLQAADPDKAIGECPCISFFDTETDTLTKAYFDCPVPTDLKPFVGFSCFDPLDDLAFAAAHRVPCLELRPNAVDADCEKLIAAIKAWRKAGGVNLSVHLSDVSFTLSDSFGGAEKLSAAVSLANAVNADRVTLHVPKMRVRDAEVHLDGMASYAARELAKLSEACTVGVENMHMTSADAPDDTRRFGYLPDELLSWRGALVTALHRGIGVNLDVGHARNNAPYSQKYTLSAWYAEVGKDCVGYHLHQVINTPHGFENHMPVTEYYGSLISFASFFYQWEHSQLARVPAIFEIRGHGEYAKTMALFGY